LHIEIPSEDLMDENALELNLNEAPMEQNELQLVVYSPDQAAQNLAADVASNAAKNVPQPIHNSVDQAQGMEEVTRIGMVLLPENLDVDPGLVDYCLRQELNVKHVDGVRLWAKKFAPFGQLEGILVPDSWCDFFTFFLLNPTKFEWTKSLLQSGAWQLIQQDRSNESTTLFQLPQKCPSEAALSCPESLNDSGVDVLINETLVKPRENVALRLKKDKGPHGGL
jgi:hypothetical protein